MLIDTIGSPKINFVEELMKKVIDAYMKHLSNKLYFMMKLSCLKVKITETKTKTKGLFWNDQDNNVLKIYLSVNPLDSQKYIGFVIAHELAHLLLCNITDALLISGRVSSVIRIDEDGNYYGASLEELMVDYIAHFIVSKMELDDENEKYAICKEESAGKIELVSKFESYFGESLMDMEFIDYDFSEKEKRIGNFLWYAVTNDFFDEIIGIYNKNFDDFAERERRNKVAENSESDEGVNYFESKLCRAIDKLENDNYTLDSFEKTLEMFEHGFRE